MRVIYANIVLLYIGEHIARNSEHWTVNEISKGVQDYLICIEMFFASVAFTYAFSYKEYRSKKAGDEESKPFLSAFFQSSIPDDIVANFR